MAALLVIGLLLSACEWPQPGFGPEHRRHNTLESDLTIDNVASLAEVWSADVPGAQTEPIVADDQVYVTRHVFSASGGVWVRALDAQDGATVWDRPLANGQMVALPAPNARFGEKLSAGYNALVSGECTTAHADLDPSDGSGEVVQDGITVSPAVTAGSTVFRTTEPFPSDCVGGLPKLVAADTTGAHLWSGSLGSSPTSASMPTVADGRVFVAAGLTLYAFDAAGCGAATCSPVWSVELSGFVTRMAPVASHDGRVFVISDAGAGDTELIAVSAKDGSQIWRHHLDLATFGLGNYPTVAVAGDVAYVTTPGTGSGIDQLKAFATGGCGASTCDPLWSAAIGGTPSAPTIAGGVVYVGTGGTVHAYDAAGCGAATCSPIVSVPTPGGAGSLSVAQGKLFVAGADAVTAFGPTAP